MLSRTHLAITGFFVLFFIQRIEGNQLTFVLISFFASLIPDIDSRFSRIGKKKTWRILQFFVKHRGIIHSFIFLFVITGLFVLFFPKIAFPFFLGYGLHLFADCFTLRGVRVFYPSDKRVSGRIKSGGRTETIIFVCLLCLNFLFLIFLLLKHSNMV